MLNSGRTPRISAIESSLMILGVLFGCDTHPVQAAPVSFKSTDAAALSKARIPVPGKLVRAWQVFDNAGEHLLVLASKTGPSQSSSRGIDERTDLNASLYRNRSGTWEREWAIQDAVDCPGLDHTAAFFPEQLTVTDLDANGTAEVTVPYKLFCGGGIDPATLKVIMRQGNQKLAVRGTTRIEVKGDAPFGGEAVFDKALSLPANAAFKNHIESVRARVAVQKY